MMGRSVPVVTTELFKDGKRIVVNNAEVRKWEKKGYSKEGAKEESPSQETETETETETSLDLNNLNEEELAELVESEDLDLDLSDYVLIEDKRKAIHEALTDED